MQHCRATSLAVNTSSRRTVSTFLPVSTPSKGGSQVKTCGVKVRIRFGLRLKVDVLNAAVIVKVDCPA